MLLYLLLDIVVVVVVRILLICRRRSLLPVDDDDDEDCEGGTIMDVLCSLRYFYHSYCNGCRNKNIINSIIYSSPAH